MGKYPGLAIVLTGARLSVCLVALALLLGLPCDSGVGAVTFAFSGFQGNSLNLLSNTSWNFNSTTGCFKFDPTVVDFYYGGASGRLLYPFAVQMIDPGSTTVKSFSTSFIYQIQRISGAFGTGPGMAFIIVPDDITIGASWDFMGLITEEIAATPKNYESDNHTLGVEVDTYLNPEFNDPNDNHIGINLASMNSTYSFAPVYSLASSSAILYRQIWIDYFSADSRMDIYYANYNEGKPAKPQGSQSGLDLSLLQASMFAGFSSASKLGSYDVSYVCAWSFSNDGIPAPSIVIATPGTLSPSSSVPAQGPSSEPPTITEKGKKKNKLGIPVGVTAAVLLFVGLVGLCTFILRCRSRFLSHPLRIFISHTGGQDGSGKIFPTSLHDRRKEYKWSISTLSNIIFFLDKENIHYGQTFPEQIFTEIARSDVALVVLTDDFFERRWPMTELIAMMNAPANDTARKLQVLPLFYKLTPDEVKDHLEDGTLQRAWEKMSEANHPLEVDKCRDAVTSLCKRRGIVYCYKNRDHDREYIEEICKHLDKILRQERSFPAYLWGAITSCRVPSDCRPRRTGIQESEMVSP